MKFVLWYGIIPTLACLCHCQSPTMVVSVVEMASSGSFTFVCNVLTNLTRWTYLSGLTGTLLMSYQNGQCTVSPSGSFLSESTKYSYACNSTLYNVTIQLMGSNSGLNNLVISCSDVIQPGGTGSTWMIKIVDGTPCTNCNPPITFNVYEIPEGEKTTFICRVSSDVPYVNWNRNIGLNTAAMGVQNGQCTSSFDTTFLDNENKYIYTCNKTAYELTVINVRRSEHNDMYMCTPPTQQGGTGTNWIVKVNAPVTSVAITPSGYVVNVKETTAVEFTCTTSTARPAASVYWYRHPTGNSDGMSQITNNITTSTDYNDLSTTTSILRFVPTRQDNNTKIFCKANNSVNTSAVKPDMKRLLNVLYPPMVSPMNDISKQNGTQLNVVCNFTAGMPEATLIKWTRDVDNRKWNTTTLNIVSLERSDTGIYTCIASNTMNQSGDNKSYIGQHNQSFQLDVQYAASIISFHIDGFMNKTATVNESDLVRFICNVDSNPTAGVKLSHDRKMLKNVTFNNLEYNIATARCLDAGTYTCSAQNMHNYQNEAHNTVQLFVNCSPRVEGEVYVNITSERDKTATLVFNVIAYPPPKFTWYQLVDGTWTLLHDSVHNVIKSTNLQSNLTIHNVEMDDFTSYKVVVENEFSQMEQIYTLSPYVKPDPPTGLRQIENRTTTSSIHIEWEPGFDNGLPQTFHIKYKKSSDTVWKYLNVSDNGKQTMNITLTGLLENTQYDVIIFASNVKGNSTESSVLITRTKAIHNPTSIPGALIGGIAGGVTGCIVIVIVIVFIIRRCPLFKGNGADGQKIRSVTSRKHNSSEDSAYNTVSSVNNYEMVNLNNVESTPYALLGHTEQHNVMTSGNGADGQNIRSVTSRKNNSSEDSAHNTVTSVHNYEMVNQNNVESTPYSTLDQTEQHNVMTSDPTSKNINDEYENMKIQVL